MFLFYKTVFVGMIKPRCPMMSLGWLLALSIFSFAIIAIVYSYIDFLFHMVRINAQSTRDTAPTISSWFFAYPDTAGISDRNKAVQACDESFASWRNYSNGMLWNAMIVFGVVLFAYVYSVYVSTRVH